jgi:hypothetical protein
MTTQPLHNPQKPVTPSTTSFLGILFFIMGAPHVYGALKRQSSLSKHVTPVSYFLAVLVASAVAGIVELTVL